LGFGEEEEVRGRLFEEEELAIVWEREEGGGAVGGRRRGVKWGARG